MKLALTPREQRLLLVGGLLALAVFWTYTTYIIRPLMREVTQLGHDVAVAREQLRGLELAAAQEAVLSKEHQQLNETVMSLQRLLPDEKELSAVLELLSDLASQSDVKIQTIFPQRPSEAETATEPTESKSPVAPTVYSDVVIQIDATAGFHQLGTFLALVESQPNPMRVASLKITADQKFSKHQRIKMLIHSYFSATGSKG